MHRVNWQHLHRVEGVDRMESQGSEVRKECGRSRRNGRYFESPEAPTGRRFCRIESNMCHSDGAAGLIGLIKNSPHVPTK